VPIPPSSPNELADDDFAEKLTQNVGLQRPSDFANARQIGGDLGQGQRGQIRATNSTGADQKRDEPEPALSLIDASIAADPINPIALLERGRVLVDLGRYQDAIASFDEAISLKPKSAMAFFHRGRALAALNHPMRGIESFEQAIELQPDFALAHLHRGLALGHLGRFAKAIACYDKAIELDPALAVAHNARGVAKLGLGRPKEALAACDKAIALNPALAIAHDARGVVQLRLGRPKEALASCDRAIELDPSFALAHSNRGAALRVLKRLDEALAAFETAIAIQPRLPRVHANRGAVLIESERLDEAAKAFDVAIAQQPNLADAHWNRALLNLMIGSFDEGWRDYEWRKLLSRPLGDRTFPKPLWLGQDDISGKSILVHYEQGLGDTIQFSRLVARLHAKGARVKFAPQPALSALLRPLSAICDIVGLESDDLDFDYHCPLMSLPLALGIGSEAFPDQVPYLRAEPDRIARWQEFLGQHGFKVGICWQGSISTADLWRSFHVREFDRLSDIPGLRLISLQKGAGVSQLNDDLGGARIETLGADFDSSSDAFLDTAAVISLCDLVITTDTSIAHLAGAMGAPTWMVLSHTADWRWMRDRADSPWYPTMRLFRQKRGGEWGQVFDDIKRDLIARIDARRASSEDDIQMAAPEIPVSWGELIDKVTILEIKCERLTMPSALANATAELTLIKKKMAGLTKMSPEVAALRDELFDTNARLWDIEDQIRDKERVQEFDEIFIELSRSIYKYNDRRSELKRQINVLTSSSIVEEKSYKRY
jgi:tetratricopeptide (TPR) repeat protein